MSNSRFGFRTRSGVIATILEVFNNIEGLSFKVDSSDTSSYSGTGIEWNDLSGYSNNGSIFNTPIFEQNNLKSFKFDGVNSYANFGNSNTLNTGNSITVFSIFQINSTKSYQVLTSKKGNYIGYDAQNGWELANSGGYLRTTLSPSIANSNDITYFTPLEVDRWYIATFTYNGNSIKLYLDGQLVQSLTITSEFPVIDGTGDLMIGKRWEGGFYKGNILYTSIYAKTFSDNDVLEEYNLLKPKISLVTSGLVLNLDANNTSSYSGSGNTWFDLSGGNNNGTLSNSPIFDTVSKSFKFNGINQSITIAGTNLHVGSNNYTWSAWLNFGPPINEYREIWYGNAGGGNTGFGLTLISSQALSLPNTLKIEIYGTTGERQNKFYTLSTDIYDTWNHWTITIDQSNFTLQLYINSILVTEYQYNDWGVISVYDNYVAFGKHSGDIWFYDGSVSQISIYNRKLDITEIGKNYNITKYRFNKIDDGLIMHLDVATTTSYNGSGTTWYDLSGNNNNVTIVGTYNYDKRGNGSIILNSINSYISTNFVAESPSTIPYTYEITFSLDSLDNGYFGLIGWAGYNIDGFNIGISSYHNSQQYLISFNGYNLTNSISPHTGYALKDSNFYIDKNTQNVYTITLVANGRNIKLYQNAVLKTNTNASFDILKSTTPIKIGGYTQGGWGSAPIRIYNVKIYNKALTEKEIIRNWNSIKNRYDSSPIVTNGLKLYLDGENTLSNPRTGTIWYDLSGYNNNSNLTNGPVLSNQNSGVIRFDGVNDYGTVTHNDVLNFGTGDFTVMMWVGGIRSYPGGSKTLIRKGSIFDPGYPGWSIVYAGTPQRLYVVVSGTSSRNEDSISGLDTGWSGYKLIGLQRKSNILYFINDLTLTQLVTTDGKNVNNTEDIEISRSSYYNSYLKSDIGMVALYNRALSIDEITLNYNVTKNKYKDKPYVTSDLVLNLDAGKKESYEGTGLQWTDLVAGNNAGLVGGPLFNTGNQGYIDFDGVNDFAFFSAPITSNVITIEIWAKISSGSGIIVGFDRYNVYSLDGNLGFNTANGDLYGISSTLVNQLGLYNNWNHYVFVMRSDVPYTNNLIYINGVNYNQSQIIGSEAVGNRNFNSGNGRISTWEYVTGYYKNQSVGLFRVYNRQLSLYEIGQNYNATKQRYVVADTLTSSQTTSIVTSNIVLHLDPSVSLSYPGTGSTWKDISGNRLNGTLISSPVYSTLNDGIFIFNGTSNYVNLGNQSKLSFTGGVFTIECWVYVPSTWTSGTQYTNLISKGARSGWDTPGWSLYCFRDYGQIGRYVIGVGLNNSYTPSQQQIILTTNDLDKFIHITVTITGIGNICTIYKNSVSSSTSTQTTNPGTNSNIVYIAKNSDNMDGSDSNTNFFPGRIGLVRLYDRSLTLTEVLQNFNATKTRFGYV